ncbi:MAG: NUDIX domain-containing protein [Ignavibacteria bacterium]|nr:NUDIX domain-containing protein [Ignavibacteria bacterium]
MAKKEHSHRFGVYAVLKHKDKFILIKKGKGPFKGRWDLPGGKINFGETPKQTLKRELLEETGLKLASYKLLCVEAYTFKGNKEVFHHTGVIFNAKAKEIKGIKRKPDGNDSYGAEVFTKKEMRGLKLTPLAKKVLKDF